MNLIEVFNKFYFSSKFLFFILIEIDVTMEIEQLNPQNSAKNLTLINQSITSTSSQNNQTIPKLIIFTKDSQTILTNTQRPSYSIHLGDFFIKLSN